MEAGSMRRSSEISAQIAAAILAGPIGSKQICLKLGLSEHRSENVKPYVDAFRRNGTVYVHSYSNRNRPIYAWQPSPFFLPDAKPPKPKGKPAPIQRPPPKMPPNSVFALGAV